MAKGKKTKQENLEAIRVLDSSHKAALRAIIEAKRRQKLEGEAISEDVAALAEKAGRPTKEISGWVGLIMKEEDKGGEVQKMKEQIDIVEQYWGQVLGEVEDVPDNGD